jgi:hypothetical protein
VGQDHSPARRATGDNSPVTPAETTAAFLLSRVRAERGAAWDEGRGRVPAQPSGPALRTFASLGNPGRVPEPSRDGLHREKSGYVHA